MDELVQKRRNSIALAMELRLSCTNLWIYASPGFNEWNHQRQMSYYLQMKRVRVTALLWHCSIEGRLLDWNQSQNHMSSCSCYTRLLCFIYSCLTCWAWDKMATILWMSFQNVFSWMKTVLFLSKFNWNLLPMFQLTISQHWFREWLSAEDVTSHCLNQ